MSTPHRLWWPCGVQGAQTVPMLQTRVPADAAVLGMFWSGRLLERGFYWKREALGRRRKSNKKQNRYLPYPRGHWGLGLIFQTIGVFWRKRKAPEIVNFQSGTHCKRWRKVVTRCHTGTTTCGHEHVSPHRPYMLLCYPLPQMLESASPSPTVRHPCFFQGSQVGP
jgi:hypothetical protein